MTAKNRLAKLESKAKAASGDNAIRVWITTEDGGASTYHNGTRTEYTAAEYAEIQKQWAARGDEVIRVRCDHDN